MDYRALKEWFRENKREFPWRVKPTPYAVWVSEVMLQQTLAKVVVPYFERWMTRFPAIADLARASREEVIKMWEGLGYYSRARNLHEAAKQIVEKFGGELPSDRERLQQIKGLGPYTTGAVLSFAFHQKAAAVDGNVSRVLTRYLLIEKELNSSLQKELREKMEQLLPDDEPWVVMEALIELGARICSKQPQCGSCPLQKSCAGLSAGRADLLPIKPKRKPITVLHRQVSIVLAEGQLLLKREKGGKIMQDLYEFPYEEGFLEKYFNQKLILLATLPVIEHSFTVYRARLYPKLWKCSKKVRIADHEWIYFEDLTKLPFSAGHRRLVQCLQEKIYAYSTH